MNLNIPSYIITMQGNQTSELLSQQCFDSAKKFSIEPKIFPAIHGKQIDIEWEKHNLKDFKFNQRIKKLSLGMKGCTLSHFLLWKRPSVKKLDKNNNDSHETKIGASCSTTK